MAKRPSVKEILEAARRGGPPRPEPDAQPAETPPAAEAEASLPAPEPTPAIKPPAPAKPAGRPLTLQEKLAAARSGASPKPAPAAEPAPEPEPPAPAPPVAAKPDQPTGRRLTLQEKLAAARGQSAPPAEPDAQAASPVAEPPAPATPAGRPLTLQEKLAAARGKAAPSEAGAKPAAVAKAPAAAKPAGARVLPPIGQISEPRDLAEALRQAGARKDKEAVARTAPPPKPAAKPAPTKPSTILPAPDRDEVVGRKPGRISEIGRRRFMALLSPVAVAWWSFSGAIGAFVVMMGRFMFPNVLAEPPSTVKVGLPTNFDPEEVSERFKAEWGFWIVRSSLYDGQDAIFALKAVCTHLGCPPNWLANDQKFKCPCHGSGFNICGVNFEGPAPRPLERYRVALADDGQIIVDKSQWYQQELGQWSDPDSFVPV